MASAPSLPSLPLPSPPPAVAARQLAQLQQLEDDLAMLSARLDAVVGDPGLDGPAAMGLDQASQAVHLALIEVRDCIRSSDPPGPAGP